ncbi:DUF397 domain-containing protein [Actinomadura sp. NPDC047616]|uniref:DUF397 domain-containing protein n=1 Tax=Actinomadura sp. NPDC047616 TaxID=3155914 RepID=UPI0033F13BCB
MTTPDSATLLWRKSSWSTNTGGDCVEVGLVWRKSSHSGDTGGDCVEVASRDMVVAVRDSKDPEGPKLIVRADGWRAFAQQVKQGEFDLG